MPFDNTYWADEVVRILPNDNAITVNLIKGYRRIKKGWCQGAFIQENDQVCAVGALGVTARSSDGYASYIDLLGGEISYLMAGLGIIASDNVHSFRVIERYNDRPSTTHQDVMKMYQKAIELSRR